MIDTRVNSDASGRENGEIRKMIALASVAIISLWVLSCGGQAVGTMKVQTGSIEEVKEEAWSALGGKSIYFGHQSVGFNIMDGIEELLDKHQDIGIGIMETRSVSDFDRPVFGHSRNGENKKPDTKIEAFAELMDKGLGNKVDIACFKLCYVDIKSDTDVDALFGHYRATMSRLTAAYPETIFVHVTSPLTAVQSGPKAWIKKLLGRPLGEVDSNIMRNRFNRMMLEEYGGKEPVFDLAALESTGTDGDLAGFSAEEDTWSSLAEEYTDDGGHLNDKGRRWIAENFLVFLAGLQDRTGQDAS